MNVPPRLKSWASSRIFPLTGLLAATLGVAAQRSDADVVKSFNTGAAGGGLLAPGSLDPAYQLIQSADPAAPGPKLYVLSPEGGPNGFPIGFWFPNGPASQWLVPYTNGVTGLGTASPSGTYIYRTTFDLSGFEPSSARIDAMWAIDETGADIILNGVSTGLKTANGFSAFTSFTITSGFRPGLNTLDFVGTNIDQNTGNPVGVRVEGTVSAMPSNCKVDSLSELTDSAALSFESGQTIDIAHLNTTMQTALAAFRKAVEDAGGQFVLNSAYRPSQYQGHLREVWDKWKQLKNNTDSGCQSLRSQVEAEMTRHQLLNLKTRPASPFGLHTQGAAIDVSVDPKITGLPLAAMLTKACGAGLHRPLSVTDQVHFTAGPCSSPPQLLVKRGAATFGSPLPRNGQMPAALTAEIKLDVSVKDIADGTTQYHYNLSNNSGRDVVALFVGYYDNESELLTAPFGWNADMGTPASSIGSPADWQCDVIATEEDPHLSVQWVANAPQFGIHSGGSSSFSVLLDTKREEYRAARWTVILADGDTVSGLVTPTSSHLLNISTRMRVLNGDNVLIGGFIVTGTDPKQVIIRGIGPSLNNVGITLSDPTLELHQSDGVIITNDDWKINDQTGQSQEAQIAATTIPPSNDRESAIVATLVPGNHTVILAGKNGGIGVGVVEVYDLSQGAAGKLANISSRGFIDTGDNVMIGGIIVGGGGGGSAKVIARAIGPSLNINGTPVPGRLVDPTLTLVNSNGTLTMTNDNWKISDESGQSQEAEINATTVPPSNEFESALVANLTPDNYTAIVRGKNNSTGVGVVEFYQLQ